MNTSSRKLQCLIWVVLVGGGVVTANCGPQGNDGAGRSGTPIDPNAFAGGNGRGGSGGFGASGAAARDGGVGSGGEGNLFVIDFPDALKPMDAPGPTLDEAKDARVMCGSSAFVVERTPPDLMIVLDRSGSMMRTTDNKNPSLPSDMADGQPTRWSYTTSALNAVTTATDGDISWGLKMYPTCTKGAPPYECVPNACATAGLLETPDLGQAKKLNDLIAMSSASLRIDTGATPTAPAVDEAVAVLKARDNGRPKYIILATDGVPNCIGNTTADPSKPDQVAIPIDAAVKAVADAKAAGIDVFVLGIAIKDPVAGADPVLLTGFQTLNRMADAGGRARAGAIKYYPATSEDDIKKAVSDIAAAAVSCTLPLEKAPEKDASARVDIDKMLVQESKTEGWSFNDDRTSITLNGTYCTKRKRGELKKIIISFDCPGKIPPPPPIAL
jgi:hypothetical protein